MPDAPRTVREVAGMSVKNGSVSAWSLVRKRDCNACLCPAVRDCARPGSRHSRACGDRSPAWPLDKRAARERARYRRDARREARDVGHLRGRGLARIRRGGDPGAIRRSHGGTNRAFGRSNAEGDGRQRGAGRCGWSPLSKSGRWRAGWSGSPRRNRPLPRRAPSLVRTHRSPPRSACLPARDRPRNNVPHYDFDSAACARASCSSA